MSNNSTNSITLPDVAQTGTLTFYCHAIESQNANPVLVDEKAVEISRQLDPVLANSSSKLLRRWQEPTRSLC
jgi:O-methyltransferase involved in polyketide biosynthesis